MIIEEKNKVVVDDIDVGQEAVFTKVYEELGWSKHQMESVSGTGSTLENTEILRSELPKVCKKYNINNIVDIACGDFNWMKEIVSEFKYYRGVDIVKDLIKANKEKYKKFENVDFIVADVITEFDKCVKGKDIDAVILKDVLVHFPDKHIIKVLDSLHKSSIKYVFITHFDSLKINCDIKEFNGWRPQNFTLSPWGMDKPLESIASPTEKYKWGENIHNSDKTLSLWQIK